MPKPDAAGGAPVPEGAGGAPQTAGRRRRGPAGSWMAHVKATMRAHKGLKLKQVLKLAKKTYKKATKGGAYMQPAGYSSGVTAQAGGRHRRGHKSRRTRRGGNMMGDY